jgi:hypothetical protein
MAPSNRLLDVANLLEHERAAVIFYAIYCNTILKVGSLRYTASFPLLSSYVHREISNRKKRWRSIWDNVDNIDGLLGSFIINRRDQFRESRSLHFDLQQEGNKVVHVLISWAKIKKIGFHILAWSSCSIRKMPRQLVQPSRRQFIKVSIGKTM